MLSYKNIIKEEHVDLRKISEDVKLPLSSEDIDTLNLMNEYLINGYDDEKCELYDIRPGVGISAVQIDVLKKMFVVFSEKIYRCAAPGVAIAVHHTGTVR